MENELATIPTVEDMAAIISRRRDLLVDVWRCAEDEDKYAADLQQRLSNRVHYAIVAAREHFDNRQITMIRKLCGMEADEWQMRAAIRRIG